MTHFKFALQSAGISAMVLAFAACDGTQPTGTAVNAPEAKEGVVFSEAFADAGQFTIAKAAEGGYNYSVSARIGSEAEKRLATSFDQPTLADVYREINTEKTVTPAVVTEVSQWLEKQRGSASQTARTNTAPLILAKSASQSDFANTYCKDFPDGYIYYWKTMTCVYKASSNYMGTPGVFGDNYANDRVWAWNPNPWTATMSLWNSAGTAYLSTWHPTLSAYWVTWFSWGGTYSNATASMKLSGVQAGELGLSNHARYAR